MTIPKTEASTHNPDLYFIEVYKGGMGTSQIVSRRKWWAYRIYWSLFNRDNISVYKKVITFRFKEQPNA